MLSSTAAAMPGSGIREIATLAARSTSPVVRLELGEPSAATPVHIVEAATRAAQGRTGYTASAGMDELREAAAEKIARVTTLPVTAADVVTGQGAVQLLATLTGAIVGHGDEVLVPDPGWPNYEMQTMAFGATPVRYPLRPENGFLPDPAEIEALITSRTKLIIVNSPSNPTGQVFDDKLAHGLVAIAERHGIVMISDEVYDEVIFDGHHVSLSTLAPEMVISVFSLSKTYSMTGWRVGYAALPKWFRTPASRYQEAFISSLPVASQHAAIAALTGPQDSVARNLQDYRSRRDLVLSLVNAAGLESPVPQGAFYQLLPLVEGADSRLSAIDLVSYGVSMAPGSAFGNVARSYLRISLASSEADLRTGIERYLTWFSARDGGAVLAQP